VKAWVDGDAGAEAQLIPLVYNELRHLARYYKTESRRRRNAADTAIVHEAYMRLIDIDNVDWQNASISLPYRQLMRRILVMPRALTEQ
jgi:hypothetical protein